jgi:hypothetical protein
VDAAILALTLRDKERLRRSTWPRENSLGLLELPRLMRRSHILRSQHGLAATANDVARERSVDEADPLGNGSTGVPLENPQQ